MFSIFKDAGSIDYTVGERFRKIILEKGSSKDPMSLVKSFLGRKNKDELYFGPFPNSYSVKNVLDLIQKIFKLRDCSDSFFKNRKRPCLQYEIGRCSAPCVGNISQEEYLIEVQHAKHLLQGKSENLIKDLYRSMDFNSKNKLYERAVFYRD